MSHTIALVRKPGFSFKRAISSHPKKHTIDIELARTQHQQYISALEINGIEVITFPALENCPDAPFVEDTAVVFDYVAVACPNKENSRRKEGKSIHEGIKKYRDLEFLPKSVSLDGGDVLQTEEKLFVGISSRTNFKAVDALAKFTSKPIIPVEVFYGLHLKTSVTYLGKNILLLNTSCVNTSPLDGFKWIEIENSDRYAANCLAIGNTVLMARGFNKVKKKIHNEGFKTLELDMSEFEKADGGITCLSILLKKDTD